MAVSPKEVRDLGTPELSKRRKVVPRLKAGSGYAYDLHVVDGTEPDRMLLSGRISVNQHSTLNSFMVLLHRANFLGPKSPALERRSSSDPAWVSAKSAIQMAVLTNVIRILDDKIGKQSRMILMDMCLIDKQPPDGFDLAAAVDELRKALDLS